MMSCQHRHLRADLGFVTVLRVGEQRTDNPIARDQLIPGRSAMVFCDRSAVDSPGEGRRPPEVPDASPRRPLGKAKKVIAVHLKG